VDLHAAGSIPFQKKEVLPVLQDLYKALMFYPFQARAL
jgi:hypothetical protein